MKYDVIIIGGGPAGLTAGIFACRGGLNVILLESTAIGGKANLSYEITNYPGLNTIAGYELVEKMKSHAEGLGLKIEYTTVEKLKKTKLGFSVSTRKGTYTAKKVVIACGCKERRLGLDDEARLIGKGISFCASCDGMFYRDKVVAVVGGGNTAIDDVKYLSRIVKKVYLINRREIFRAGEHELNKVKKLNNVEIIPNAVVTKLHGDESLDKITISVSGKPRELEVSGLFEAIGAVPEIDFLDMDIARDESGYIIVDEDMCTSEENVFACGDVVAKKFRQIVTACADGAVAGNKCIES